ncbi:hypothetical protein HAHE_23020 [Haloferula helveola]|uniref:Uncharacterized protein n=1 Tax=Haloferula helveola TaxID=490095 RepID=A0ABM7RAH6_9BACT|nr:hypothetical protein HAHE_23020 [Haloferula helveola]
MVAPIITFVFAAGVAFLAWQSTTVETDMREGNLDAPMADESPAVADDEPADEPADDSEDMEESEE